MTSNIELLFPEPSDEELVKDRVALLLRHFSEIDDQRDPYRVMFPLNEILFLLTCATISSCDDFDDIVAWGEHNLPFLRQFSAYENGIPCARWIRALVNRVPPALFARCFDDWTADLWPDAHDHIAIDGKTSRRTHDKAKGIKPLHTLSAYATNARLVLAQIGVPEKTNEITAIPELLDELAEKKQLKGSLVTIDAMGCQVEIAERIVSHGADFLLMVKGNQRNLEKEIADYFRTAPEERLIRKTTLEKGHGRIEGREYIVSGEVEWLCGSKSYPGAMRFSHIKSIVKVVNRTEYKNKCTIDTRYYICSLAPDIERIAAGSRGHWGVESMHWLLDVAFKDDYSRYRSGSGAKNMAVVRRFALDLVRRDQGKGSVKTRRKSAGWDVSILLSILKIKPR